jgi:hypothetical protein
VNIEAEFFYKSQPRLQFIFDSPNHCSVILGMLALVLCGALALLWGNGKSVARTASMIACAVMLLGLLGGLVLTYSRGGWVAFFAGLAFYWVTAKPKKIIPVSVLVGFLCLLWLLPHGWQRMNSMTDVTEDRSILHRVMVWQGALTMAADHPLTGIGGDSFGNEFSAWYQPLTMNTRYLAALSNYLTLASERGFLALFIYLLLLGCPFAICFYLARKRQNALIISLLAVEVTYLISGLFTYSTSFWHVTGLFLFVYIIVLGYLGYHLVKKNLTRKTGCKILATTAGSVGAVVLVLYFTGLFFLMELPCRVSRLQISDDIPAVMVVPQNIPVYGTIIHFHDKGGSVQEDGKSSLRPMAQAGFMIIGCDYRAGGIDGLRDAETVMRWAINTFSEQGVPLYLTGFGVGGRMAILVSGNIEFRDKVKGVAAVNAAVEWPFPELSPLDQLGSLQAPVLLIYHDASAPKMLASNIANFLETAKVRNKSVQMICIPNDDNQLNLDGLPVEKIDEFFRQL